MRLPLRGWILLGCFLPLWLVVVGLGGWLLQQHFDALNQQLYERGQLMLKNLSPTLVTSISRQDRLQSLRLVTEPLLETTDVRAFSLYDHRQASLVHAGPSMRPLLLNPQVRWSERFIVAIEKETLRFIEPLYEVPVQQDSLRDRSIEPPALIGWAELELSRTPTQLYQYRVLLISGAILFGLLLLSLLLTQSLLHFLQRWLDQTLLQFQQVGEGKALVSGRRFPIRELGVLQQAMLQMADQLREREEGYRQSIEETREDALRSLETIEIKNIELDHARRDALQASRIKSEFLANMSHEIRTPLNGIIGFSNLLSRSRLEARQKEYLSHILGASETMLGIINDILDFSKIEAGMMVLEEAPLNLRELLAESLALLAPQAHRQNLDLLGLVYDDVPEQVKSDPLRLKQLLGNLISNALKFTEQGEVVVRIMLDDSDETLFFEPPEVGTTCRLRFVVTDTGIGLNEMQRQKLFRAFSQADTTQTRRFGGTGLGLAICKQLVQQMGGQIDLDSTEGEGSTFWFSLPLQVLEVAPVNNPWLQGKTLGVLETHRLTNQAWSHQLRNWGAQVISWDHPERMLEQLDQQPLAAVLLGMNARQATAPLWLETISRLRTASIPLLVLINSAEPELHASLRRTGAEQLLLKPLSMAQFRSHLQVRMAHPPDQRLSEEALLPQTLPQAVPTILAVDDTPSNLLLLVTLLRELGFQVLQAENGHQALQQVKTQVVDLVLMDIQMPEMDGVQATRQIRSLGREYRTLPVIALTAHAVAEERDNWLQAGINDVLIKPLHEKQLIDLLQRWLGSRFQTGSLVAALPDAAQVEEGCPVDRELGIKLAAGRSELADELLGLLLGSLGQSREAIDRALRHGQDAALIEAVHRLHGASRYCGVPDLAQVTEALETQLKSGQQSLVADTLEQLFHEIDRLQEWRQTDYRPDWHRS